MSREGSKTSPPVNFSEREPRACWRLLLAKPPASPRLMSNNSAARMSMVQRLKEHHKESRAADDTSVDPARTNDLRSIRRAIMVIAILACGAVVWAAQSILVPTALGVILALILNPLVSVLERIRIPTMVASIL